MEKHCKTCQCGIGKRHTCKKCGTKKLEKYLVQIGGEYKGWGHGGHWECLDQTNCTENKNYA